MDRRKYQQAALKYFRERGRLGVFSDAEYRVPLRAKKIIVSEPR